mgnify:FL=1
MALPLILFFYRNITDMRKWAIIFVVSTVILIVLFWEQPAIRYMLPGIALLSASTAIIIDAIMRHNKLLKAALFTLLIASLIFNAAMWYGFNAKNVRYFLTGETQGDYYDKLKNPSTYGASSWINANTTPDSAVMLVNDPRGYFLDRKYIISSPYQSYIDYYGMNGTADLLKRLKELGVSYILINDKESPINNKDSFNTYSHSLKGGKYVDELLRSFLEEHAQLMYDKDKIRVYRILAAAA